MLSVIKLTIFLNFFKENLNLEEHLNGFFGSKVTAILVRGGTLPSGGVASGRVCACSLCNRLVYLQTLFSEGAFIAKTINNH